jgi:ribosome-binding factor A
MAHNRRQDQLGELIAEDLSDLIRTRMKDPRIGFASVTSVEVSADLRHAKVFISVMGSPEDQRDTIRALEHASGFLRHELAQRLTIRYTPDIAFRLDESIARGARIMELMRQVQSEGGPTPTGSATANDGRLGGQAER